MTTKYTWLTRISSVAALALLVGCASNPTTTAELERARDAVDKVASMPDSSTLASAELKEAQETSARPRKPRARTSPMPTSLTWRTSQSSRPPLRRRR
jgi:hypothetical protein